MRFEVFRIRIRGSRKWITKRDWRLRKLRKLIRIRWGKSKEGSGGRSWEESEVNWKIRKKFGGTGSREEIGFGTRRKAILFRISRAKGRKWRINV